MIVLIERLADGNSATVAIDDIGKSSSLNQSVQSHSFRSNHTYHQAKHWPFLRRVQALQSLHFGQSAGHRLRTTHRSFCKGVKLIVELNQIEIIRKVCKTRFVFVLLKMSGIALACA